MLIHQLCTILKSHLAHPHLVQPPYINMASTNLPLPVFYAQTLTSLVPLFDDSLSLSDPSAQSVLADGLANLHLIGRMVSSLGVFSDNEGIEEVGDREMTFMTLGWVVGEAEAKGGLGGYAQRKAALERAQVRRALTRVLSSSCRTDDAGCFPSIYLTTCLVQSPVTR